ncbi:MAG: helix-turn-helix domain-containing protein [Gemmatimonadales bacterium]|nr:helix-turn-helix domain-containing protein [Gemmatimonadales bacterium]
MPNSNKNIDLTGSNIHKRLLALREERHLTKKDLALKAHLSARTIHDLENGRRDRIFEKTLMLLAKALEVPIDKLLDKPTEMDGIAISGSSVEIQNTGLDTGPDASSVVSDFKWRPSRRTGGLGILAIILVILVIVWVNVWSFACDNAEWILSQNGIHARDSIFGLVIWEITDEKKMNFCQVSPWRSDRLLVGLGSTTPSGGRLLNLNRATGEVIWSVSPDIDAIVRAFGEQDVLSTNFRCKNVFPIELDGDPATELVVVFFHGRFYPVALCAIDDDGRLLHQYAHKGHLGDFLVTDLDGDGRDELIAAGTNNAKAYQGGTFIILDHQHWRGASIDSLCDPWSSEPDSAKFRLVIPQYPQVYMNLIQEIRLIGQDLKIKKDAQGEFMISGFVGSSRGPKMLVNLDHRLKPIDCQPNDVFYKKCISQWPDSLTHRTGPGDPAWRSQWLAQHRHFEAGHWPPAKKPEIQGVGR